MRAVLWLALLLCGASASASGPEQAYARIQAAVAQEQWGEVYDSLSQANRQAFEDAMPHIALMSRQIGIPQEKLPTARDSFVRVVPKTPQLRALFEVKGYSISSVEQREGRALLQVKSPGEATPRPVRMVDEGGLWKLDVDL